MKLSCIVLLAGFFCFGVMNAAVAGECPKTNVLKEMVQTTIKSFAEVSPLDITKIKSSGAFQSKDGKKMAVCLSNGDFTAKELASEWVSPIKKKEDFIFVLQFRNGNDKIAEGEYSAAAGFGKPRAGKREPA